MDVRVPLLSLSLPLAAPLGSSPPSSVHVLQRRGQPSLLTYLQTPAEREGSMGHMITRGTHMTDLPLAVFIASNNVH